MKKRKTNKSLKIRSKDSFFKTYFILVAIYAVLGIIDTLFITGNINLLKIQQTTAISVWLIIFGLFQIAIFILSVVALVRAIKQKLKFKIILPILLLADFMFFTIFSLVSIESMVNNFGYFSLWVVISSVIICLAELVLAICSMPRH
jgi:hypothetical protein